MCQSPRLRTRLALASLLVLAGVPAAQPGAAAPAPAANPDVSAAPRPAARAVHPIVLGPDDGPTLPDAPAGFDAERAGIPRGEMKVLEYDSRAVGTRRRMTVYTPPGYSPGQKYPVLYLLHGIGGDETEWPRYGVPGVILDNLLAERKAVPMRDDRSGGDLFAPEKLRAFADFEGDLFGDVIPAVEAAYSVQADRGHRALAGLSIGGGQSLNFGLGHLDRFAWIGAFSAAPNTKAPAELAPDPAAVAAGLRLLWVSSGNRDSLIYVGQGVHAYLKGHSVPHVWHVDGFAHDTPEWRNNFYLFSQRIFR